MVTKQLEWQRRKIGEYSDQVFAHMNNLLYVIYFAGEEFHAYSISAKMPYSKFPSIEAAKEGCQVHTEQLLKTFEE